MYHMGQGRGIISNNRHIHDPTDVGTAVADENPDPWIFPCYIDFLRHFNGLDVFSACLRQIHACRTGCGTGLSDGRRDIFGTLEGTADVDAVFGCGHRLKSFSLAKSRRIQRYIQA